jgi:hypothetical protein
VKYIFIYIYISLLSEPYQISLISDSYSIRTIYIYIYIQKIKTDIIIF